MITKKLDSNTIWENAEKLASFINDAYLNFKKSSELSANDKKFFMDQINEININLSKRGFVVACEEFGKFLTTKSDYLPRIVKEALSLPLQSAAEDKDITFEMFITCLNFHLAFYKKEWKLN